MGRFATWTWVLLCPLWICASSRTAWTDSTDLALQARRARVQALAGDSSANAAWPSRTPVKVELVYRYESAGQSYEVVNAYARGARERLESRDAAFSAHPLPDYFIVGDGALSGRMILVDKRPGSRLSRVLDELERQILGLYGLAQASELRAATLTSFLAAQVSDYLAFPASGALNDPAPGITQTVLAEDADLTSALAGEALGTYSPAIAGYEHPVRPFERALRSGQGVCIDMALLASFMLERFGVPHRVVFGAVVAADDDTKSDGHTWVELPNGEILDAAWRTLAAPAPHPHPEHSDWRFFGNATGKQYRFGYPAAPIVILGE